jgi:glycogen synthase
MKVLMLGWEFPPLFSGGLGIATYGMVKALRSSCSIKLIVPRSDPSSSLEDVNIIGLNNALKDQLTKEGKQFNLAELVDQLEHIPLTVSPYQEINKMIEEGERQAVAAVTEKLRAAERIGEYFSGKDVYGWDIGHKVYLFAELADHLAGSGDFQVIHAHDWLTYPAGIKIKKRTGRPLVMHVHALETDRAGEDVRNEIYYLEKNAFAQADAIIAVSAYTKDQLRRHYDVSPERVTVVHNGIEPKEVARKEHKLKDKLIVFLGRITHQKGPHFLLETAGKVVKVFPDIKFVVAGTGDQFADLLESAAYQKLGSKFIFTGFLSKEKVEELLTMADIYFMPSVSEPFGLTALEAAQHAVPGVLSRQSGADEVLTALSADFWDTDKYANYIHALLRYKVLHQELATKSHSQSQELTWDRAAAKIYDVYKSLAEPKLNT